MEKSTQWQILEIEIEREIGRFTDGTVEVERLSDTKAVVYIDDKDVPAAIGKGGKNIAAIVNKVGVGIDIRPKGEREKPRDTPQVESDTVQGNGVRIKIDKKNLTIIALDQTGKIVDVFAGKEYLFTATVNEAGEILLAKNSTISQEMIRRYNEGEAIRLRPV